MGAKKVESNPPKYEDTKHILMGLDVSTATIGITIMIDDGTPYGHLVELTHASPKVSSKIKGIEALLLKKRIFKEYVAKFKTMGITDVVIEEPLLRSNNVNTVATLLRFNGMISDCVYEELGVVPVYISSHDARKFSFPQLMAVRKYDKKGEQYSFNKLLKSVNDAQFTLFGAYPWEVDKKTVMWELVSKEFSEIAWVTDKKGELKKENFDATDSYVACLGWINRQKYGELEFTTDNVKHYDINGGEDTVIEYDVHYWDRTEHRKIYSHN